jgi:hypothetical protein
MKREQLTKLVVVVDAELTVPERRASKLRELKRLALELDEDRPPRAAMAAPATARRKSRPNQSSPLTAAEATNVARGLLADGPTTVGKILEQLGRSRTQRATAVVEEALGQLGATVSGRARGGGNLYALAAEPDEDVERGRGELLEKIGELARSAVGWSDEEFQYQLRKRCGIDASLDEVQAARLQLNGDTRAPA